MRRILYAVAAFGLAARVAGQAPIQIPFASQTFGPDGPWQAVEIKLGSNQQPVHLLPGGWFESTILSPSVCNGNANCPARSAGTFDANSSSPSIPPGSVDRPGFIDQWSAAPETNNTGTGVLMADSMMVVSSDKQNINVPDFAISLVESNNQALPNGTKVPTELGFLGLGGYTDTSQYQLTNGTAANGQMLPNYLANTSQIPSVSFGLHIGSAPFGQSGSLVLGGYDQMRAIGDFGAYTLGGDTGGEPVVPMVDLTLGVMQGGTPFNTTQVGSLYRNAATLNTSEPMSLNPTVPYMQMPLGMCEAVAEFLPVTFNENLGLYLWNINDPQFAKIVRSPAYMGIAFARAGQPNLLIQVPFSVLNLTLTAPLVSQPTQYFPCKPSYSTDDKFYLGRAFLQSAYLTVNWQRRTFTMSQGSGPDSGPATIVPIQSNDDTIGTSEAENFIRSWSAHWNTLPEGPETGISPGTKVGIAIGAISGAASLISVIMYFIRRHNKKKLQRSGSSVTNLQGSPSNASSKAQLMMREGNPRTPLPGYPGPNNRQWYTSGMKSVKEMEGSAPYYGAVQFDAAPYGRQPSQSQYNYGRNTPRGYGYGRPAQYGPSELGHTQITELQARNVQHASPDSPVEIHGREVGLIPFALRPEDLKTPVGSWNMSPPNKGRASAASSQPPAPHRASNDRPNVTRNSKGFWEVSPASPESGG